MQQEPDDDQPEEGEDARVCPIEPHAISLVEEDRLYPQLTVKQEAFVVAYVIDGGHGTKAVKEAGYSEAGAHVRAHALLRHPSVQKAIFDETNRKLAAHLPGALAAIVKLSSKSKSDYVKLEASKDLLDRAGMAAPKKVAVAGQVSVTFDLGER